MVKSTLSVTADDEVEEALSLKDLANANTGSSSITLRKEVSTTFCKVPVFAKRCRSKAEVPDS